MRVEITAGGILKIMADDSEDSLRMRMWLVENKNISGTENMLFDTCPAISDQPSGSQAEVSDTELLDWLIKSECAVLSLGHGEYDIYSTDPDNGGQLLINQPSPREAIKAAMRAQEGS